MNYFEFRDNRPSLDVVDWPGIQVTETELTNEEREQWTQKANDFFRPYLWPRAFSQSHS